MPTAAASGVQMATKRFAYSDAETGSGEAYESQKGKEYNE